ncbi:MAG: hypothetical protein IKY33_03250 [Clostridia bacterium]|nr:hypothetical protein [Clostridia bacterium]
MKKRSIVCLLLILVLLLGGCATAINKGFYLYRSSPLGFKMEYPETWTKEVDLDDSSAAFITPQEGFGDPYLDNLAVSYEELGEYQFADFFDLYYDSLPSVFSGFAEEEKSEVLLNEKEAYKIVFSSASEDEEVEAELKVMQYVVLSGERVYFITYSAHPDSYEYFLPFVNTMLETFTFSV